MVFKKYIGSKQFYKTVLAISVPIMIQNGITNFVSLLDNIMVGRLSTEAMSGVSIVNQFIFIFNLLIFGAISAAGIFTAQYHGFGDKEGVKHTFRYKNIICILAALFGIAVFYFFQDQLIGLFLHTSDIEGDLELTLRLGKEYLLVMLFGLIPFALSQAYSSTMRETGETLVPMIASICAVLTNFVFNYILIFGKLGSPALGVKGAAIATVISRFVELFILVFYAFSKKEKCYYMKGAYTSLYIPKKLSATIAVKGLPLMVNELFWSLAVTLRNQCYSTRGLEVVAAQNISSTVANLFNVVYLSMGSAVAIIIGNLLGAGKCEEAKDTSKKMIAFSVFCSAVMSLFLIGTSFIFPEIYNTEAKVKSLATFMIIVYAIGMPFSAYANSAYFTLRSGGKVFITLIFDSIYMWAVVMPVSFGIAKLTGMDIKLMFILCQGAEALKALLGFYILNKGTWANQLIKKSDLE